MGTISITSTGGGGSNLNATLASLQEQINELKTENESLSTQVESLTAENTNLKTQLDSKAE